MAVNITVYPLYSPRIIQVDSPQTEATIQDLIDAIRDWEDGPVGEYYDYLIDAAGKEDLGGGVEVGITATLQNAQVYFPSRSTPIAKTETCTTADTDGRVCISSTSTFVTDGLVRGDVLFNATTGAMATIISVDSETQVTSLPLTGGSRNDWQIGDAVWTYNNPLCSVSGGNLVAIDSAGSPISAILPSPMAQVVRTASSSATTSNQESLEFSSFQGGVAINTSSSYAGTSFPIGTREYPVNNLADAHLIAMDRGLNTFYLMGNLTINENVGMGHKFLGDNPVTVEVTVNAGANINYCTFENLTIGGVLDDGNVIKGCVINTLTSLDGYLDRCALNGSVTLGGTLQSTLVDCVSNAAGGLTPTVDFGGSGSALAIRGWRGGLKLTNKTGADACSIDMTSGQVVIDSTVTAGDIYIRGTCEVYDNSTGTAQVIESALSGQKLSALQAVVEQQRKSHPAIGQVWYWDPYAGDDNNDGRNINRPFATFAKAHTSAVSGSGDLIIAMATDPSGTTTTTELINITKNSINLRGPGKNFIIDGSSDDLTSTVQISGNNCQLEGLRITNNSTNSEYQIHLTGDNCQLKFLWAEFGGNALHIDAAEEAVLDDLRVVHNTGDAITISGAAKHITMYDCHIAGNTGDAIDATGVISPGHGISLRGQTVLHGNGGYGFDAPSGFEKFELLDTVICFENTLGNVNTNASPYLGYDTTNQALTTGEFLALK